MCRSATKRMPRSALYPLWPPFPFPLPFPFPGGLVDPGHGTRVRERYHEDGERTTLSQTKLDMRRSAIIASLLGTVACSGGADPEDFEQFTWHLSWSACLKGEVCEVNVDVFASHEAIVSNKGSIQMGTLEPATFTEFSSFLVSRDMIEGLREGTGCSSSGSRSSDSTEIVTLKLKGMGPLTRNMAGCHGGAFPKLEQWVSRIVSMFSKS